MNTEEYSNFLMQNIKPFVKKCSGGSEINCRCFYCSDSDNMNKGHFYISTDLSNNQPSKFYCQRCLVKGYVTPKKLLEWGLYDSNIFIGLSNYNKRIMNQPGTIIFKEDTIYKLYNRYISDTELSRRKLQYINDRLGLNLTYKDCLNNKIVLNISDLLDSNHITNYTRHISIMNQLDNNFIGFISYDNSFINMRNLGFSKVYDTIDKRYVNYNIFNKYDNTHRFYTSNSVIDLSRPIKLHIAEGVFDILSILYNLNGGDTDNSIYSSIGGKGYLGLLRFFISTLKLINLEIHIYPDSDISKHVMDSIIEYLKPFKCRICIHRNIYPGEKDYGVKKDRIIDNKVIYY